MSIIDVNRKIKLILQNDKNNLDLLKPCNDEVNNFIFTLYDNISDGLHDMEDKLNNNEINFEPQIIKIDKKSNIPSDDITHSNYVPTEIKNFLKKNCKYDLQFNFVISNRKIIIHFVLFDENKNGLTIEEYKNYAMRVYIWLYMTNIYSSSKCVKTLNIYFYLTEFKRILPKDNITVLDIDQVNGGFSTVCEKDSILVVYRKEEWFKVFIHETMHNFSLDFAVVDIKEPIKELKKVFCIPSDIRMYETYCEFWARIIFIMFKCYFSNNGKYTIQNDVQRSLNKTKKSGSKKITKSSKMEISIKNKLYEKQKCIKCFYKILNEEILFSAYQTVKILNYMGLDYEIVTSNNDKSCTTTNMLYKENTNVFAYYILTYILISNFNNFIMWCKKNNKNVIQFTHTKENVLHLVSFFKEYYQNKTIINTIQYSEKLITYHENIVSNNSSHNSSHHSNHNSKKLIDNCEYMLNTTRMTMFG